MTKLRPHLDKLLLALIFVVLSTSTILWTLRDQTPPPWDPADHLRYAYDYYRLLAHADFSGFAKEFFITPHDYAPCVHLAGAGVFMVLGFTRLTSVVVNLLSLAALLWAVAWISRNICSKSPAIRTSDDQVRPTVFLSVLPALLAAGYHFSGWLIHDAFLDFPLTAAVTVSFALLIRAGDFRVRRYALAFGLAAGLGMLVKQTFCLFFVLPAVYVAVRVLRTRDRRAIMNLALATAVLIVAAAIWYGPHLQDVITIYRENRQAALNENEAPLFSFESNFYYIHALLSMQMQLPLAALFVAGMVYSLARCRNQSMILYLWILSGIVCFTLVANKDVRYTAPVLPAAALISVCWLREFKPRNGSVQTASRKVANALKPALVAAIAAWALVSFFNAQWPRAGRGAAIDSPGYRWMVFSRNYYGFDHRPLNSDWSVPDIVRTVSSFRTGQRPVLGVVVNMPFFNPSSMALYSRFLAQERAGPPLIVVRWVSDHSMSSRIEACDYILMRTGLERGEWVTPMERDMEQLIRANPDRFARAASFPTPIEGSEAVIYRRTNR